MEFLVQTNLSYILETIVYTINLFYSKVHILAIRTYN